MESDVLLEESAPLSTEGDQVADSDGTENSNEILQEIRDYLLQANENVSDVQETTIPVQEVPVITEEEFIKFNNNYCVGLTCLVLVLGVVCGSIVALSFKGIFKE